MNPREKAELKPCPIPGCTRRWKTPSGLFAHLFQDHLKAELITWILQHLERSRDVHELEG